MEYTYRPKSSARIVDQVLMVETPNECLEFHLKEISPEELLQIRLSGECGFIWKQDDNLMYTSFPKTLRLQPEMFGKKHLCVNPNCKYFLHEDEKQRCPKTFDPGMNSKVPTLKLIKRSKRIEKYKCIMEGYEVFNSSMLNAIAVLDCKNYQKSPKRKKAW